MRDKSAGSVHCKVIIQLSTYKNGSKPRKSTNTTMNKPQEQPVTPKQRTAIKEYFANGYNWPQAMIEAGYSKNYARKNGYQLLAKQGIKGAIEARKQRIAIKADVTIDEVVQGLRSIAFDDTTEKVNTGDRIRSLELLGKYKAMFVDKHVLSNDTGQQPAKELESAIDRSRARAIQINAHVRTVTPGEGGDGE